MNEKVKTIKLNGNGKVVKIITDKNEHEADYFSLPLKSRIHSKHIYLFKRC